MKKTLLALFAAVSVIGAANAEKLVIKGSDTLGAKLVPRWAEIYKSKNPGVSFEIAAEGSSTGIAALIDDTCDLAMSSRRAKPTEMSTAASKGINMKPTIACFDGIAIIANKNNSLDGLSLKQVESIFTGDVSNWSDVGGSGGTFSIYTRNTASGTYSDFKKLAMSKRDYAGGAQKMAGNEQIVAEVQKNPNGIGYVGLAYISSPGIKVLAINGKKPSEDTVRNKSYPIARPTFFYTNGAPSGVAADFLKFALSPEGAKVVREIGFVPVK